MTLHIEELFLKKVRKTVNNSKNIFYLVEINKYVQDKTKEYAEENNIQKTGEYFILSQYIDKKMTKLISEPNTFRTQ